MSDTPEMKSTGKKSGKGAPVFTYLAIMFAAAFLMLLLAYFIQQRNSEVAIDGLKDSISSSHASLDELKEENQALKEQLTALQEENSTLAEAQQNSADEAAREYAELEAQYRQAETEIRNMEDELGSWEAVYKILDLYSRKEYQACAEFIVILSGSTYYVPPEEAYSRVVEIYDHLVEDGYLDPEDMMYDIIHWD